MIKYLSDLGVMYMIKSNQILDEKDKRLRKKSIDVTFPLEDKYKKFIDESIEMLTLSQIEEEAEKYILSTPSHLRNVSDGVIYLKEKFGI